VKRSVELYLPSHDVEEELDNSPGREAGVAGQQGLLVSLQS